MSCDITKGFGESVVRGEQLQRAIMAYVLEAHHEYTFEEAGLSIDRVEALTAGGELLTVVDLEALAKVVDATVGQLIVRAQRQQLTRDPVPFPRPQVRHDF